jgi:hypothetical protein
MPDLTFDMPEGFSPPENLDSDETFQAMATFKVVSEGELQLVDVDGYQIGDEDTEGDTDAASEADQANAAAAVSSGGPGAANQSQDQMNPAANQTQVGGYAEQMGQKFKAAIAKARRK